MGNIEKEKNCALNIKLPADIWLAYQMICKTIGIRLGDKVAEFITSYVNENFFRFKQLADLMHNTKDTQAP